jgi:hypothetical protein
MTASMMNWRRMSLLLAPTAFRMPISRVRSVTETYMMFMMPIPPTTSEMPAMAPSQGGHEDVTGAIDLGDAVEIDHGAPPPVASGGRLGESQRQTDAQMQSHK